MSRRSALFTAGLAFCGALTGSNSMIPSPPVGNRVTFLVGPKPALTDGIDRRRLITIPRRYIELSEEKLAQQPIVTGQFSFAFRFPDAAPVARDRLAGDDVVIGTLAWEPPGSVRKRIDGSWINHFSAYDRRLGSAFGLDVSAKHSPVDESKLYSSVEQEILIECEKVVERASSACTLISNSILYLAMEASFQPSLLPNWRQIVTQIRQLISRVGSNASEDEQQAIPLTSRASSVLSRLGVEQSPATSSALMPAMHRFAG